MARESVSPERIVDLAATLADRDGPEAGTTLSVLARELGVRPPSLYKHIPGRPTLLRLLAIRAMDELADRMAEAAAGRSGAEAVHATAEAYRAYAHARPGLYAATAPFGLDDDPDHDAAARRVLAILTSALRAWDLDEPATIDAIRSLRAALHGFVSLERSGGFGMPREVDASFDWLVDALIAGLGAPRQR